MTIALSYADDTARTHIELSDYDDGTVLVERSTDQMRWTTVRGGAALPIFGGVGSLDDWEFVDGVENFYRVSRVEFPLVDEASITPSLGGVTWIKSIKYPQQLNRPIPTPDYQPVQRAARTGLYNVKGRVPPIAAYDTWTSQYWTMETVTNTLAEARDLDLLLVSGGTFFVHVPAEFDGLCFTNPVSGMPGGYVRFSDATREHTVGGSHVMAWSLPIRVVAAPSPFIFGGELTWTQAFALYGSESAMWSSNPSWRDVWPSIGNPGDPLVLT